MQNTPYTFNPGQRVKLVGGPSGQLTLATGVVVSASDLAVQVDLGDLATTFYYLHQPPADVKDQSWPNVPAPRWMERRDRWGDPELVPEDTDLEVVPVD